LTRASASNRLSIAIIEQNPPLGQLDVAAERLRRDSTEASGFAQVDEGERIPIPLGREEFGLGQGRRGSGEFTCSFGHLWENWMVPKASKPILAVPGIRLPAMEDAMPVAAAGRQDFLTEVMAFLQEIVIQPDTGQTATGHGGITDRCRGKGGFHAQGFQKELNGEIGRARAERVEALFGQEWGEGSRVESWFEHGRLLRP
jgi:hypothetical protein